MNLLTDSNQSPHMIAILSADKKHIKFYIAVKGYLASVSIFFVFNSFNFVRLH